MFRATITGYLAVWILIGPLVCCCAHKRPNNPEEMPAEAIPLGCCCEHGASNSSQSRGDRKDTENPEPARHQCPCRDHAAVKMVPMLETGVAKTQIDLLSAPAVGVVDAYISVCAPAHLMMNAGGEPWPHFLTAEDILRAFHILRC